MSYNYIMEYILKIMFITFVLCLCISCYYVESLSFEHENYGQENPFDQISIHSIMPFYDGHNAFLINIRGYYVYKSSLFYMINKSHTFNMSVNIYSDEKIENITINSCEILFGDNSIVFDNNELSDVINGSDTHQLITGTHYFALFKKTINTDIINNYVKARVNNENNLLYILVNIDIDYIENGEIKNWKNTTKFYIDIFRVNYSPENLWGGLP